MILKALTLENFKGIREPVRIEFAPLTLLFGPNNAGKSTVLHALLYAHEILERNNTDAGRTQLGGDVVDLGGFKNLVYGHDLSRKIRMRFELENVELPDYFQLLKDTDYQEIIRNGEFFCWFEDMALPKFNEISRELIKIWIQIEIGWDEKYKRPSVLRYQVGKGESPYAYATIEVGDDGYSAITQIDRSTPPFGGQLRYTDLYQLDVSDQEKKIISQLFFREDNDIENIDNGDREEFEKIIRGNVKESYQADAFFNAPPPSVYWKGKLRDYRRVRVEITESWLSELCNRLICYTYFGPDHAFLPLQIRGTALPDFEIPLSINPKIWLIDDHSDDNSVEFSRNVEQKIIDKPAFGWVYLTGFLTSVIAGPGKRLLTILQESLYISSFRDVPDRSCQNLVNSESEFNSWANGLSAWSHLISQDNVLADNINKWLMGPNSLNTGYQIEINRYKELDIDLMWALSQAKDFTNLSLIIKEIKDLPEKRRLWINDIRSGTRLLPRDLGVGISRIFPVLVAALYKQSGLVAIEEPESNTHPAFQVVLGDLFISQARKNPGLLFLIETHSEHLMLRCLRRIRETREGKISEGLPSVMPEDVSVHFVEPSEHGSRIHRIHIDEDGDFADPWPLGFFPERFKELYGDDL